MSSSRLCTLLLLTLAFLCLGLRNLRAQFTPPVPVDATPEFLFTDGSNASPGTYPTYSSGSTGNPNFFASVPVGKSLLIPVVVSGSGPLTFTASSTSPAIVPIIKTGYPVLNITVSYAGDSSQPAGTSGTAPFTGTMSFALLRDMAPKACGYIAGIAESGSYNGREFFRIANLDSSVSNSFIAQAGDPANSGTGAFNSFTFDNESNGALIFSGGGQLAMANGATNFAGSNSSQFFVTKGSLRPLDFNYTIFGQLLSGWDVMSKIMAVPLKGGSNSTVTTGTAAMPTKSVFMDSVTVTEDNTDAILILSAAAANSASTTITVNATDLRGRKAVNVSGTTSTTGLFLHLPTSDDKTAGVNDPPYFPATPDNIELPLGQSSASIPIRAQDLEFDDLFPGAQVIGGVGSASVVGSIAVVKPSSIIRGLGTEVGLSVQQGLVQSNNSFPVATTHSTVALADGKLTPLPFLLTTGSGQTLAQSGTLAMFLDSNPQLTGSSFSAVINYGDGSPLVTSNESLMTTSTTTSTTGTNAPVTTSTNTTYVSDDTAFSHALNGGPTTWAVGIAGTASMIVTSTTSTTGTSGTTTSITMMPETTGTTPHIYPANGIYPLTVTVTDTNGGILQMRNPAVVAGGPLYAEGHVFTAPGGLANAQVADFHDTSGGGLPSAYAATINWGDGNVSTGTQVTIRGNSGHYFVYGRHQYAAGSTFPVDVAISSGTDSVATAWSIAKLSGVPANQPPFPQAHVNGQLGNVGFASSRSLDAEVTLVNSGNKNSGQITLTFFLSTSQTPSSSTLTALTVANKPSYQAAALKAGAVEFGTVSNIFLPAGVTAAGKFLVVHLDYSDNLQPHMDEPQYVVDPSPLL